MSKFKKYWWILALVAIIFIVIAILARAGVINKGILGKQNQTETVVPKKVTFNDKVIEHEGEIIAMQNTIDGLSRRLDALETCCSSKTTVNRTTTVQKSNTAKKQDTNQSSIKDSRSEEKIENIYPLPKDGQPSTANLDYLEQDGKILLCILVNGLKDHYFPQFALDRGVKFTAVKSNLTEDGSNWEVEPVTDFEGDVGVTMGGIFFIKAALLETILRANGETVTRVDIKTPYTKWQAKPMVLLGDYWVFETTR